MKNIILLSAILSMTLVLFGCSRSYDVSIVNRSSETIEINITYEKLFADTLPFYMSFEDWEKNQQLFSIILNGKKEWNEMPTENYESHFENAERKIKLAPNEVLRIDRIRSSPKYESYDGDTNLKSISILGKNGDLILKGKYIYKQFEVSKGGFFIAYK